jgi:hypothetical protein
MVGGTAFLLTGIQAIDAVAQGTPVATPATASDAERLLTEAATAMTELDTFAFSLVTVEGETTIMEGLTLEEISGVVRRPTDFQTTVTVEIPFASLDLTAVSVNEEIWIELPAIGDGGGGWTSLGSSDGLLSLLNPDVVILQAVPYIDDAAIVDTGEIDGVAVTYVSGTVDFRSIASRLAGEETDLSTQLAEGPVELMIAIDDEKLIREIEMRGPLLASEEEDVVRLVTFSDFNEPVEIEEPEVDGAA